MGQKFYNENDVAAIAEAIRAKNGLTQTYRVIDMPGAIAAIPSGSGPVIDPDADVRFFDYDGKLLHTYTAAEFQALESMPDNPSHVGLTAQGWNWTLADAKAQVTAMGQCDIGQMYVTASGDTEIDIELFDGRLDPICGICVDGEVTIDWGDNTTPDTKTGNSLTSWITAQHTYAQAGEYTIKIHVVSGEWTVNGTTNSGSRLLWRGYSNANYNAVYNNAIKSIKFGNGISTLSEYAFCKCYSLTQVTIPLSVTTIENNSFHYCYSLEQVTIPTGVTTINDSVFNNCSSLTRITIPASVTTIDTNAFSGCYSLAQITIPADVTSIGSSAFYGCNTLTQITIPTGVTSIGSSAFNSCYSLAQITIPAGVTSINGSVFYGCYSLAQITIPADVTSIGSSAFNSCYSLAQITIPTGVTTIGTNAFSGCYSLAQITIPADVTTINGSAFNSCYGIKKYILIPTTPPTLSNTNVFSGIQSDCQIIVPRGSLTAYQTANNWSTYASYMVEASS